MPNNNPPSATVIDHKIRLRFISIREFGNKVEYTNQKANLIQLNTLEQRPTNEPGSLFLPAIALEL